MPSGTLIANSHCYEAIERIPAATLGPIAAEVDPTSALIPMPRPSWSAGEAEQGSVDAHDPGVAKTLEDA